MDDDLDEKVLCGEEWRTEATAIINDVQDHVTEINIADGTINEDQVIHLNLTTKENERYCIELTAQGFRVVGKDYDKTDVLSAEYFETPYALLDKLSPLYRQAFGNSLASKLLDLYSIQSEAEQEKS